MYVASQLCSLLATGLVWVIDSFVLPFIANDMHHFKNLLQDISIHLILWGCRKTT